MILLGVNIDHTATLRQARYRQLGEAVGGNIEPDPVALAFRCEQAGADGITIHLREDRRHIQESDVRRLGAVKGTRLNLEMACTPSMTNFALQLKPHSVCLVPESREEITTEGGLDVVKNLARVARVTDAMNAAGIKVSLFIDPDLEQIELAAKLKATWVELHTGAYANAYYSPGRAAEFSRLIAGAQQAHAAGLIVNAGHGINYINITEVRTLPHLCELNIGHSIISRALFSGIDEAVRTMKALMNPRQ
ncbi:MAG: Pyridoxine 5-phosphate synthase [Verrucomicrobiota bacterium]|jgi:pyridoxine 5-phosphate synthase|nr:MAG: pyridoxine 5'-phosphate synthase [Opitutae bacterium Tous-C10FEB]